MASQAQMNLIRFIMSFLFSTFTVLAKHLVAHLFTSRIDGLLRSNLLLGLALTWPTFNNFFSHRWHLFLGPHNTLPDCRLNHLLFRVPLAAPALVARKCVCGMICLPSRASVAETFTTCPPICTFPRLSPSCGTVVPLPGFLSRITSQILFKDS